MTTLRTRRTAMRVGLTLAAVLFSFAADALVVSDRYRSPRNPERKVRRSTELIVLHTTEAPARSSLNKLSDRGEAHFCVTESGGIYRIVDRDREAFHAGRSMWRGREDVDKYSVGIECVGYHNKPMPLVQLYAIRDLVTQLKTMYRLSDDKVVCHSHVAYGTPNKWQKRRHRGRKRCGMLFAMPSVRRILNLRYRPGGDVDTRSGRLAIGDPYLHGVLYGRTDTMVAAYRNGASPAAATSSGGLFAGLGNLFKPKPSAAASKPAAKPAAKPHPRAKATIQKATVKKPPGKKIAARAAPTSIDQLKKGGWTLMGMVTKKRSASQIAGNRWNASDTYYTIRNRVIPGNQLNAAKIENGMGVWLRK